MAGFGPTQPAEEYFNKGLWGFDGVRWRKLGLVWAYTDRYAESLSNTSCATGANVLAFSIVPVGEVWRITSMTWVNVDTACSVISAILNDGVDTHSVFVEGTPALNVYKTTLLDVVIKAGDRLQVAFYGCVLNDDIYATLLGYKMAVT